jgi:hypothetical protein
LGGELGFGNDHGFHITRVIRLTQIVANRTRYIGDKPLSPGQDEALAGWLSEFLEPVRVLLIERALISR